MINNCRIVLASGSPRRKELLRMIVDEFDVVVSDCEEKITKAQPEDITMELSQQKAQAVSLCIEGEAVIIGADTVVALDDEIMGKPATKDEARRMIKALSGRKHRVVTGVTIVEKMARTSTAHSFYESTDVYVATMSDEEIEDYISTPEPYDKAGGYGIQGLFARFVERIEGDYLNVVGLPVHSLYQKLI